MALNDSPVTHAASIQALVTIIAPLALDRVAAAEAAIDALGNPAQLGPKAALDLLDGDDGTHFCSLHAIRSTDLGKAYLAFEVSADGTEEEAIGRIARAIGPDLTPVFRLASDWTAGAELGAYLLAHRIRIGVGLLDGPGLAFAGTPGMSVGRIRREARLALRVSGVLARQGEALWALERIETVRAAISGDPEFAAMLGTATLAAPDARLGMAALAGRLAVSFCTTYLWPIGVLLLACAVLGGAGAVLIGEPPGAGAAVGAFVRGGLTWLLGGGAVLLAGLTFALAAGCLALLRLERRDPVEARAADQEVLEAMFRRENHCAQNHMLSVTERKPGAIRWFTSRLVFWIIGGLTTYVYPPGFLSDIGTIHFARWVTVPRTRDVLFFSNYDGSWESYLEDFIARAHHGLTGVWSNSIGFPRSRGLFLDGATDGERFKRYARRSMVATRFWYCAYPTLTTTAIRTNAKIRQGLFGPMTDDAAMRWLALFGSAERPAKQLVTSEIQSIIFGGLGFLPFGICLFYDLPEAADRARGWLAEILPRVAFDDGRWLKRNAVLTLAMGPAGLTRLGLPDAALETLPYAFLTGPSSTARARILGDTGPNAAENWRWGRTAPHAAMLVYGLSVADVDALLATLADAADAYGVRLTHQVQLQELTADKREPFGFVDGLSQPVIRGTYKGLKTVDPIHLVEPGEFILGYPDNRGNTAPGPTLPAAADPRNILPTVDAAGDHRRDFGRNGSFLVIRELEQDVDRFRSYCAAEAARLCTRLPEPYAVTPEFIGAKLVGRWQNGASLVRSREPPAGAGSRLDNGFLYGTEDPEALRCPFGAHVRRANPRDSLSPGSQVQIDITNRHRIIRIGRHYVPQRGERRGLFFMCLNGDLERQFEFLQQTWIKSPSFHGLVGEQDPLLGDGNEGLSHFTMPSRYGPIRLSPLPRMVRTRGAGYFFLPGKRLLEFLAVPPAPAHGADAPWTLGSRIAS